MVEFPRYGHRHLGNSTSLSPRQELPYSPALYKYKTHPLFSFYPQLNLLRPPRRPLRVLDNPLDRLLRIFRVRLRNLW